MTIHDIAREAGVSTATVSRVLNNQSVRPESRAKVEAAVAKLDYVPNAFARGLMSKRSRAVGLLVTSMTNAYYMSITETVERRFRDLGSMLFLCSTDGEHAQELGYLQDLVARQVDGIIVIDPSMENYANGAFRNIGRRLPLVFIHSWNEFSGLNAVTIDQWLGMERVMEHLWGGGHRRIAFLRGFHGHSYDIKEQCWRAWQERHGRAPAPDELVVISDGNTEAAIPLARDAIRVLLGRPAAERPSAIFACNDIMALGVVAAAHDLGLRVPEELSIVGHDNTALAWNAAPPLTTVDLKMRSLGNAAVDLLLHAMDPRDPEPRRITIEPELVVRGSSAPAG